MAKSRNEQLLEALLNGETADIVPQSRNEAYLKAMIEGNTEVAEPRSRIEAYLCALARNGSSGGGSGGGGSSGGTTGVSPKEVNFYDYDGTCVHAYTVAEAQALSKLPAGPEHPGLVFQGWNWSLEGVNGLTRAMNIGAMYTTDDGTTRLYITLQEGRTSPMLGVGVNGTVTVDWGDGTEPDVLTGTNINTTKWTPNHAYAKAGDYVIRLTVDGEMAFTGTNGTNSYACILRYTSDVDWRNRVYQSALRKVECGNGATTIKDNAFYFCRALTSVIIPEGTTSIGSYAFQGCSSLRFVTTPGYIGSNAFRDCTALLLVAIPESVRYVADYAFYSCMALASVIIPDGVTSMNANTFSSSHSLASVIVPKSVTSIANTAFYQCVGVAYYDFTAHTAVPTLSSTNAFTGIPTDCEIRVPAALYDEWIAATNWSTYVDYIKAY